MESSDIHDHHHELQDQVICSSSSSFPCCNGVASTTAHHRTPNSILNTNGFNSYPKETILMNPRQQQKIDHYSSMAPEISGFHWANSSNRYEQDLQLSRIKEEFSDNYYLKYTEILNSSSPSSSTTDELSLRNNLQANRFGSTKKLLLNSFSEDLTNNGSGLSHQINFPRINFSNSNQEGIILANPGSLEMNLQPLDLLPYSSRFNENFSQNDFGIMRDGFSCNLDHLHQSCDLKPSSNKLSAAEAKRSSSEMEQKELQNASKKSRVGARASCPPFKVRKERLGDRIAALQQLVAPFGKTDTASVLMEAIGYIKFLQAQVETLSVPYMKTSRSKTTKMIKTVTSENKSDEPKRDLKSRGLCLVPLSCMSYIADGGGAVVWPPPHFGGATL